MCGHTQPEAGESGDAGNTQKLPGFAAFLSFSALDEARTGVALGMPTSPALAGPSKLSPNPYAGMHMPGSARDQFRNWFSDPGVDRIPAPLITGRRASETPVRSLPADSNNEELRPRVLEPQVQLEQRGQPWRPNLSSTALLAPREGSGADRGQHLWRRASMGNMLTGNSTYPPTLVPRPPSASATGSRSLDTDCQATAPIYKPGSAFPVPTLTRPVPLGQEPTKLPAPERVKSTLNRLLQPAPGAPEGAQEQQAPSSLPESNARPSVPAIASSGWEPACEKSSSTTAKTNDRKRKASDAVGADDKGSPPAESERKRFKCPVQGCNSSYTWKENLTRHKTTRHAPVVRYCPFCKVNAVRLSFNRTDNFQGHILRHFRGRENSRARTEFDPAAEAFYRGITDMARREKQGQVKVRGGSRGTAMIGSPRSEASDDTVEVPDELCIREYS